MLLLICTLVFAGSFLLTFTIEKVAKARGVVSKPSYRRKKDECTPLLGGLGVFVASAAGMVSVGSELGELLLLAFLPMLVVGVLDDVIELGGRWKLGAQLVSAGLWLTLLPKEGMIFTELLSNNWIGQIVAVLFVVGTTNAYNFLDGMDGLASTLGIIGWLGLATVFPGSELCLIMAAAQVGFLLRNWNPAKVYLGEVGGAFIGFTLGAMAIVTPSQAVGPSYFVALLFLFSLPFSDVVAAMFRRILSGKSIFFADREHIHHRLLKLQFGVTQALGIISIISIGGALTFALAAQIEVANQRWLLFALSGLLLSSLFWGIFLSERLFSKRIMTMSKSLLSKHFSGHLVPGEGYQTDRALLIDLMPYYREVQINGVLAVDGFIEEIAAVVKPLPNLLGVSFLGSYSLVVHFSGESKWTIGAKKSVTKEFYALLQRFNCLKSDKLNPEGLWFFDRSELDKVLSRLVSSDRKHPLKSA